MKPRLLLVALLVLAAAAFPVAGAEGATKKKPNCSLSKKWDLVKKNSQIVVFTVPRSDGSESLYGCNRKSDKRVRLADSYDDDYVTSITFDQIRVNGRFVAWQWTSTDISCKADCPPDYEATTYSIERADVKTGKTLRWDDSHSAGDSLKLSPKGNVAWVQDNGTAAEVRTGDSTGNRAIDSGAIKPESLKLSGTTLSWVNGETPKSATLP